jgi:hypothetical protein
MFGKRELQVKLVKSVKKDDDATSTTTSALDPETLKIVKEFVRDVVVVVAVGVGATLAWKATLEIIVRCVPDR